MIPRNIYKSLKEWKISSSRKPLLIRGARQVGKSYIVDHFAKNEFANYITINFERNPEFLTVFQTHDPREIIEKISLLTAKKIVPGKTLLFLDEIQDCPNAIVSLRYFYEELPDLHVVGAGSLLEFTLESGNFKVPVGRIQYLYMLPLSLNEFMEAIGEQDLIAYVAANGLKSEIPDVLHDKLLSIVRKYFLLGGMPAVVNEYIKTGDIIECRKIQRSIIDTYIDDFGKYSKMTYHKNLIKVFYSAAAKVGQKFVYASIDNTVKSRELKLAVELLETAGVIKRIKRTNGDGLPLEANVKDNFFKLLFLDIGLMHNISQMYGETILQENLASIFQGAVAEQFVGQELLAIQNPYSSPNLYYWAREAKSSNAEVDYLVSIKNKIIPIEVKSGNSNSMRSLRLFMEQYHSEFGIKISEDSFQIGVKIISIPFYGILNILNLPEKQ